MSGLASVTIAPAAPPPMLPPAEPGEAIDSAALEGAGVGSGPAGAPGEGPSSGPSGGPAPAPSPTPTPTPGPSGGGPAPAPSPTPSATDEFAATSTESFLDILKTATTPEALEAQNIILRRIALQGDVIPSRVPPPRNISEIGGYLNLLTTLNEIDMRSQVLAGILGVAGPNPPLGWVGAVTALTFTPLVNDRPAGPLQPSLPVTILVRSDFAGPLKSVFQAIHDRGCQLPLMSGPLALPPAGGYPTGTLDPLDYIGRTLYLSAGSALTDAASDPIALVRETGSTDPYQIALRSTGTPAVPVPPADYDVLQRSAAGFDPVPATAAPMVMLASLLAGAGFYPPHPLPLPTQAHPSGWAKLTNIGGLAIGTRLGDELQLFHSTTEIAGSCLAAWQNWRWNGTAFAA